MTVPSTRVITDAARPNRGRNLALLAALLGWMFDGMEMGLFPLVAKNALGELLGSGADKKTVDEWYGVIIAGFLVGAATGGVLFGWLGDRIGRVRAMTLSVLVYSVCSGLSAASTEAWHLAVLRFAGALGMGGEWALGVALVMEMWPNASRAWLAGGIGAFGNLGYTLCGSISLGLNRAGGRLPGWLTGMGMPDAWAASLTANGNWRLLLLMGMLPALLTLVIRLFVPESEKWQKAKDAGTASCWATRDLIGVLIGAAAAAGVITLWVGERPMLLRIGGSIAGLVVVTLGFLYPARQFLWRSGLPPAERRRTLRLMLLAAGLSGVPLLATWSGVMWMYLFVPGLPGGDHRDARAWLQVYSSVGAAAGCVVGALLCVSFGRRAVYAGLCVLSLFTIVGFYRLNTEYGMAVKLSAGLMGFVTASFYGWLPLYLPELFPTKIRATGQGFGFNFGRIIAAVGNLQMASLLAFFDNDYGRACSVVAGVYFLGLILIAIAPETKGKPLPE